MGRLHLSINSQTRYLTPTRTNVFMQKQGFFYMVGRDCKFRPIIVVNVEKLHDAELKEKTFYDVIGYFFQYVVQNCLLEGQV